MSNEMNPLVISARNPKLRAAAIKAMCAHCVGCTLEHLEPGFRDSIRGCTYKGCPLYHLRPYRAKKSTAPANAGSNP
jgi:hypothetical protein